MVWVSELGDCRAVVALDVFRQLVAFFRGLSQGRWQRNRRGNWLFGNGNGCQRCSGTHGAKKCTACSRRFHRFNSLFRVNMHFKLMVIRLLYILTDSRIHSLRVYTDLLNLHAFLKNHRSMYFKGFTVMSFKKFP